MRIFVGIDVPDNLREQIEYETDKLLEKTKSYKKSPNQNYHLTLKFIGEIEISDIVALNELLIKSLENISAFDVTLKDISYFDKGNEYIIWMGAQKGVGYLKEIHHEIDEKISQLFSIDRAEFTPHITLARKVIVDDVKTLARNRTKAYTFRAEEVSIFYSHRIEGALTYTQLSKIKLK